MCKTNLADVLKCQDPGGNASGVVSTVKVATVAAVDVIPEPTADTYDIATDITMVADVRPVSEQGTGDAVPGLFYDIQTKKEGLQYTTTAEGDEEDGNLVHTIAGVIPKMRADKSFILDSMRGGVEHILIFTDRNGRTWVMGSKQEGVTFSILPTTDGNGYAITASWMSGRLLYGYSGAVPQA